MRSAKSNAGWEHPTRLVLPLLLVVLSCAPALEDCRTLLPVMDGAVTLVQTPLGTPGCSCTTEDVLVVVEARRHYLSFERGQVWIDGTGVTMQEFSTKLDEAKTKHRAERMGAAIEARTRPLRNAVHDLSTTLHDLFKR